MQNDLDLALVPPHVRHRDGYLAAIREFQAEGLRWWTGTDLVNHAEDDFAAFVARRLADATLPSPAVPRTHLWAISGETFVGRLAIQHTLTDATRVEGGHIGYDTVPRFRGRGVASAMLRLALPVARGIGLGEVMLTCDDTNAASIRVIEKNGGVLHATRLLDPSRPLKRYYTIDLGAPGDR